MSGADGYKPVFSWDAPRAGSVVALVFVALSIILHALGFYLFQVVYPPSVSLQPPPASLTLDRNAGRPGSLSARWMNAEDPSLIASVNLGQPDSLSHLRSPPYLPSFHAVTTRTAAMPGATGNATLPDTTGSVLREIVFPPDVTPAAESPPRPPRDTALVIRRHGETIRIPYPVGDSMDPGEPLRSARLLARARADGRVDPVLLMESTGNADADDRLVRAVRSLPPGTLDAGWHRLDVIVDRPWPVPPAAEGTP